MKNVFIFIFILLLGSTLFTCKKTNSDDEIIIKDTIAWHIPIYSYTINPATPIADTSDAELYINELSVDSIFLSSIYTSVSFNYNNTNTKVELLGGYFNAPFDTISWMTMVDIDKPVADEHTYVDTVYDFIPIEVNYAIFKITSDSKQKIDTILYGYKSWINYNQNKSIQAYFDAIEYPINFESNMTAEQWREQTTFQFGNTGLLVNGTTDYEVYFVDIYSCKSTFVTDYKLTFYVSKLH
ncbi:MAG: hypothetical protein L3J54_13670 [Draconibacterium sp.]|nr:hypothetical protein [Draconibacterium sp.]